MKLRFMHGLVVPIAMAAASAWAGDLYKCTDRSGQVSIQSQPCPKDAIQDWKRDAAPELPPNEAQQKALQDRRAREASEARQLAKMAGTAKRDKPDSDTSEQGERAQGKPASDTPASPVAEPAPNDCRKAHQFADAVRAKEFLELSNYQLSRLSEWVAGQCRDPD